MPLMVIGAGLGRTGTSSLKAALEILGFPCYHMDELMRNPEHLDFWVEVSESDDFMNARRDDWDRVFQKFSAAIDAPANCVYPALIRAYPEAKVILTHRDGGKWYDSAYPTIYQLQYSVPLRARLLFYPWWDKFNRTINRMFWQDVMQGCMEKGRDATANRVREWNEQALDVVPSEQMLKFSVQEGWEPLCKFLNVPIPSVPFPRVNDTEAFKQGLAQQKREGWTLMFGCTVAIALVGVTLTKILSNK